MTSISILTIDDAAFIRDLVKKSLRGFFTNATLDEALHGKRGQFLLRKHQYDLVLCDWEMPEMNGLELLTWLREFEKAQGLQPTPFIMVTSRGDKQNVIEAVEAGVTDYIGKPFSNDQLLRKVIKALSRKHKAYITELLSGSVQSKNPFAAPDAVGAIARKNSSSASILTSHSKSESVSSPKSEAATLRKTQSIKGEAHLRLSDIDYKTQIRAINLSEISLTAPRTDVVPMLLEHCVVDIGLPGTENVVSINGFIYALSAVEKDEACELLQVNIKYVDQDPGKLSLLSEFIAQVN